MEYRELIDELADKENQNVLNYIPDAVQMLETLWLEVKASHLQYETVRNMLTEYQDKIVPKCREQVEVEKARAEKAERERDAAISDLRRVSIENCAECMYCLYETAKSFCWNCQDGSNWKWKGLKGE